MTNREFAKQDTDFREAYRRVFGEGEPTVRQASKYRRGQGRAWVEGRKAVRS